MDMKKLKKLIYLYLKWWGTFIAHCSESTGINPNRRDLGLSR